MTVKRRDFLKGLCATSVSAATFGSLSSALIGFDAQAANVSGYKALVCVFFAGGLDNHDTILPYDQASYDQFASIRSELITAQGTSRLRENLLALNPDNATDFNGRQFALPPEMPGLKSLFDQGNMAVIGNVGPLIEPTNRQQFLDESVRLPVRLFSHNDQQATWQASAPEGAQLGWGGLFADAALASNNNNGIEFSSITSGGEGLFLTGNTAKPYQISVGGSAQIDFLQELLEEQQTVSDSALLEQLRNHFRQTGSNDSHLIKADVANGYQNSYDSNLLYNQAISGITPIATVFPATPLGSQLAAVARTIAARSSLSVDRQVFFVQIGGFDTHSAQATALPMLQAQIDGALSAFYQATVEMGLATDVTLFTASDFGRTLAVNGDGTDHGWGGHHFAVGGAVNGRKIYGQLPPSTLDHDADSGGGRLIPSVSIEQFAYPMGQWFGLTHQELVNALPNINNFPAGPLNFMSPTSDLIFRSGFDG